MVFFFIVLQCPTDDERATCVISRGFSIEWGVCLHEQHATRELYTCFARGIIHSTLFRRRCRRRRHRPRWHSFICSI